MNSIKFVKNFIPLLLITIFLCSCSGSNDQDLAKDHTEAKAKGMKTQAFSIANSPVSLHGDLQIINKGGNLGYTLCDKDGNPFQIKGFSQLDLMQADTKWVPGCTIKNIVALSGCSGVRISMYTSENGQGYMDNVDKTAYRNRVKELIKDAIDQGIYIMIDWHILNDANPWSDTYKNEARAFFEDIAQTYGSYDNLLFELCNEPKAVSYTQTIKPYAEYVLAGIRKYSDNLVIVGTPTWSQDVDQVVGNKISTNVGRGVLYSLHFYAATHYGFLRAKGDTALNGGVPIMLSEWGTVSADGNGRTDFASSDEWLNWADSRNLSWFNWSLSVRNEASAALQPTKSLAGPWTKDDFSESGKYVLNKLPGGGNPVNGYPVPGIIEAEAYGSMNGIYTESCSEGGLNVGWIEPGDYLTYRISVASGGRYKVDYRVSGKETIAFQLKSGNAVLDTLSSAPTGDWQSWKTITGQEFNLAQGDQDITILSTGKGWNINKFEIKKVGSDDKCTLTLLPTGKTTGAGVYDRYTVVTISYTGSNFKSWSGDTATVADIKNAKTTVTMAGNISLTALENTVQPVVITYNKDAWGTGFNGYITIKNNSSQAITGGWTLKFTFKGNEKITNMWCGFFSQTGNSVIIRNESYNKDIPAGGSINLGFSGSYSGQTQNPDDFSFYSGSVVPIPPVVSITSPAYGAKFTTGADITIKANASDQDGQVKKVEFFNGSTKLGESTAAPYSCTMKSAINGNYTIIAKATDNNNLSSQSTVNFSVGSAPVISLKVRINADSGVTKTITLNPAPSTGSSTISGGNGTEVSVSYKNPVNVTITASSGLRYWGGDLSGNANPASLSLTAGRDYSITAGFDTVYDDRNDDWLHTDRNRVLDSKGNTVWMTGTNWFGFNCSELVFHGLWSANLEWCLDKMAEKGINLLRIPIAAELIKKWSLGENPMPVGVNDYVNPNLKGKSSLEVLDATVKYCKVAGMKIMLDIHSAKIDNSGHLYPVWYNGNITTDDWINACAWITRRYKNDDTILAFDLKNEPHGKPTESPRAKWDSSTDSDNWKYAAERAGNAILNENPNMLIMIEGIEIFPVNGVNWSSQASADYHFNWWGGNLRGVKTLPVDFGSNAKNRQIVYSPHDYGPKVWVQPWFNKPFDMQSLYNECWKPNWFYIQEENIAPLLIGEWGGFDDGADNSKWMGYLKDFILTNKIHHTFWCFNANSGDTGGLIKDDWKTWDDVKYTKFVLPVLWKDKTGKFVSLDHKFRLGQNGIGTNITEYYLNGNSAPNPPAY